jgi:hypothetical protein
VRLHGAVDAAGGMFGAAVLEVIEGFCVVVEIFFSPGGFQVSLVGPLDAVPPVAAVGGGFGHGASITSLPDRWSSGREPEIRRDFERGCPPLVYGALLAGLPLPNPYTLVEETWNH